MVRGRRGDRRTIKAELNGDRPSGARRGKVDFTSPDVVALVDTRFGNVELNIAPLFIYGRYRKHSREIPQTRWPCRMCRGKGCKRCGGIGKMYQTSVQELIGDPLVRQFEGKDHFFHGMGREDIDARDARHRPTLRPRDRVNQESGILTSERWKGLANETGRSRRFLTIEVERPP